MIPSLSATADRQLGVFTAAQARLVGVGDDEVRRDVRRGSLVAVRRGIYCLAADRAPEGQEQHLQDAMAAVLASSREVVASHWTAALAHGLPLIRPIPDLPQVVCNREHRRSLPGAHLFNGALHEGHVHIGGGLPRTTVARTISDVARTRSLDDALVMADFALHHRWCSLDDLRSVIVDGHTWKGIVWTKRVLEFAEPLNESPGETLSVQRMRRHALPLPMCQVPLIIDGRLVRPDFLWRGLGVIGEFDGAVKYTDRAALVAEKRREDQLRAAGFIVVRWGWQDVVGDGAPMARSLQAGFDAARRRPAPDVERLLAA